MAEKIRRLNIKDVVGETVIPPYPQNNTPGLDEYTMREALVDYGEAYRSLLLIDKYRKKIPFVRGLNLREVTRMLPGRIVERMEEHEASFDLIGLRTIANRVATSVATDFLKHDLFKPNF